MRRLAAFAVCLLVLASGLTVASAQGGKGVVQRSWVSETTGGPAVSTVDTASAQRIYASFVWRTPPQPGQSLKIEWKDHSGTVRAVWRSHTISSDRSGTRIYAWIRVDLLKQSPGTWRAILIVGGSTRNVRVFHTEASTALPSPAVPVVTPPPVVPPVVTPPPAPPTPPDDFCTTHACIPNFYNGHGTIVQCVDGMWSHSGGIQGACSGHGGVA